MIECNQQCEGPLVLLTTEKATRVICFLSFVLCGQLIKNKFYTSSKVSPLVGH